MYKLHQNCRACGSGKLSEVFDLGIQPLANDFHNEHEERAGYAPLKVLFCPQCTLAQLSVVVNSSILYSNYAYVTSKSQTMQQHFRSLWFEILKEVPPKTLVEIGSNDGDFLMFSRNRGVEKLIGIDPAQNLADLAVERGLPTICNVFNSDSAYSTTLSVQEADVIVARHVFAHIDDWKEFMHGIAVLSGKETLVIIEVPYAVELLRNAEFDTIYHEHLSYVSIGAIRHLLQPTDFHVHKVVRFPIHGGALAIMLRRNDSEHAPHPSVDDFKENITVDTWREFAIRAKTKIEVLTEFVHDEIFNGKTVCGFGASAKSTVWINACKFSRKEIKFICDCTPYKQYTFSPGSDIPIVDEGSLLRELPDVALNFAWNFHECVLENNKPYLEHGGKIVNPYQI